MLLPSQVLTHQPALTFGLATVPDTGVPPSPVQSVLSVWSVVKGLLPLRYLSDSWEDGYKPSS